MDNWNLIGNQVMCDDLPVCVLWSDGVYWYIRGDDRYKFTSQRNAYYFVREACIHG